MHILRLMNEQNVLISSRVGLQKIASLGVTSHKQPVTDSAIFPGGKNVLANGQVIRVAVDELEGEHGRTLHNTRLEIERWPVKFLKRVEVAACELAYGCR